MRITTTYSKWTPFILRELAIMRASTSIPGDIGVFQESFLETGAKLGPYDPTLTQDPGVHKLEEIIALIAVLRFVDDDLDEASRQRSRQNAHLLIAGEMLFHNRAEVTKI
jgi:hypothetical protein